MHRALLAVRRSDPGEDIGGPRVPVDRVPRGSADDRVHHCEPQTNEFNAGEHTRTSISVRAGKPVRCTSAFHTRRLVLNLADLEKT